MTMNRRATFNCGQDTVTFQALVYADAGVLRSYIYQSVKKMTRNGVGFIHHSNLGSYPKMLRLRRLIFKRAGTVLEPTRIAKYSLIWMSSHRTAGGRKA